MLTIIIPTINRYDLLSGTINQLRRQNLLHFEILIIDQTLLPERQPINISDDRIKYLWIDRQSASAARNVGLLNALFDIVLFLDDDVIIDNPNFLYSHLRHYDDPGCSGVFGAVLDKAKPHLRDQKHPWSYWRKNGWLFYPTNFGKKDLVRNGGAGNLSVRRDWAIAIGGMDEHFEKGAHREESDFCLRYTDRFGLLVFDPEAALFHIGSPTGGIRSWNDVSQIKAQHHFDGAIYFLLKCIPFYHQPLHWAITIRYFVLRLEILQSPKLFFISLFRFVKGLLSALRKLKEGPRYIGNDERSLSSTVEN